MRRSVAMVAAAAVVAGLGGTGLGLALGRDDSGAWDHPGPAGTTMMGTWSHGRPATGWSTTDGSPYGWMMRGDDGDRGPGWCVVRR